MRAINAYPTSDGGLFMHREEAVERQAELDLKAYLVTQHRWREHGGFVIADMAETIAEVPEYLAEKLNALIKARKKLAELREQQLANVRQAEASVANLEAA
jgi:hypothetical protein